MDAERRPLLAEDDGGDDELVLTPQAADDGFLTKLLAEPLTTLGRVLLFVSVALLLLASVFIGLFAGAEHRISDLKHTTPVTVTEFITTTSVVSTTRTVTTTTTAIPPPPTHKPEPPKPETCTTSECVILAASILGGLNTSADPCENFFEYANGQWIEDHPLPAGKGRYGVFDSVQEGNNLVLQRILSGSSKSTNHVDDQLLKKLRGYYDSCTNEEQLDALGIEPLQSVVRHIRGLLPIRERPVPSVQGDDAQAPLGGGPQFAHELTAVIAFLHSIDVSTLFEIDIEGDAGVDPDFMTLWVSQSELGLPSKEYYDDPDTVAEYGEVLKQLIYILDESEGESTSRWPPWPWPTPDEPEKENRTAKADRLSQSILNFETKLSKYGADRDTLLVDPIATYNPRPLANLTKHMSYINFPLYVSSFAPRNYPENVIVTYPPYFKHLDKLVEETPAEVLQAYFIAQAALRLAPYLGLNTEAWKVVTEFQQGLSGIKKGTVVDRQKWCLARVQDGLGFAAGRFFVEEVFGKSARQKAFDLVQSIVNAFNDHLPKLSWMAPKDRVAAAEKASALRIKVGYPLATPDTMNPISVNNYYYQVKVSEDTFFSNVLSASVSDQIKKWQTLGKPRNKETWEMYPSQVNAYYNPPANEIVFPAGILRPPFFGENWPLYMTYGAIGAVVAHELTHAFDSAGRLYNQNGKLESWWSNSTSEKFDVRKECLAEQYSSYTVEDGKGGSEHVNGNLTSGENIGDSGLIHSYRAWKAASNITTDYRLPGLEEYTPEQLFFLSFGRVWATRQLPSAALLQVRTDPHSPAIYRVHGTLSNLPEFAKSFNCSAKAKLNPKKRCTFWG